MEKSQRVRCSASQTLAAGLVLFLGAGFGARADVPAAPAPATTPAAADADTDEPKSLPQDGLFSSLSQSLRQGDQEIIWGHFELGSPPKVHRYYCLMDPKTRRREPNGVVGDLIARPDGMTGIKNTAVSLYRCAKAQQEGMLVTAGYVTPAHPGGSSAAASAPAKPAPAAAASAAVPANASPAAPAGAQPAAPAAVAGAPPAVAASVPASATIVPTAVSRFASGMVDVSGVKLGMSPREVKAVLESKPLPERNEWSENLSYRDSETGKMRPVANGRFLNVMAAAHSAASVAAVNYETDGESFEVMFTPVPGHERAMAIVHTVGYSSSNAIHETALEAGLAEKYGGLAGGGDLPQAATWLYQSGGTVTIGDSCGRRDVLGGLGALEVSRARENIALQSSPGELQFELQRCGIAIVTEDHHTVDGGASRNDRMVSRYTVTAYSPALAAEGASQAQAILRAAAHLHGPEVAVPGKDSHAPDL